MVTIYVDYCLIVGEPTLCDVLISQPNEKFALKETPLDDFLGLKIDYKPEACMNSLKDCILARCGGIDLNGSSDAVSNPLPPGTESKLSSQF